MHRLPSKKAIFRFRLAAALLWFNYFVLIAIVVMLGLAIIERDQGHVKIAIMMMVGFLPLAIIQWIAANNTKCPLCITPVLANKNCSRNKKAKTLFWSYRLYTSVSILFKDHYRCPYCNEPTAMEVRKRHHH